MIWRGSPSWRGCLATSMLLSALLAPAANSLAGTYHVYSCRIPYGPQAGEPAPVQVSAGAGEEAGRWSHVVTGVAQYAQLCASGGGMEAALQSGVVHTKTDLTMWQFTTPPGEILGSATVWRAGDADGGAGYLYWLAAPNDPLAGEALASEDVFDGCAYTGGCTKGIGDISEPLAAANKVVVPAANLGGSHLYINASCSSASCPSSSGDEQGHAVVVYVYATDIALEEQASPAVSNVGGELATAGQLSGTEYLDFQAEDPGSGVYRALVSVDGRQLQSSVIGTGELCKEAPVPAEDEPAFLSAEPCPSVVEGHVSLDTTQLSNGAHRLLVEVTDAAGNATPVIERTIDVANGQSQGSISGQPGGVLTQGLTSSLSSMVNGTPASGKASLSAWWVRRHGANVSSQGRKLTGGYGEAETIAGRLTGPGGGPIADAQIAITARRSYGGAPSFALEAAHTDAEGRFDIRLGRASASQRLQLTYSPTIGGTPVASQSMQLLVRAGISLHVSPSTVSAGGTIRLQGRVLGGPIPRGGKQVVLEARSGGSPWLQFLVVRSGSRGRFEGSHRFRLRGPVRYWFRAVCPQEADFPFATGASSNATVLER
jgi:hypothetical protein